MYKLALFKLISKIQTSKALKNGRQKINQVIQNLQKAKGQNVFLGFLTFLKFPIKLLTTFPTFQ